MNTATARPSNSPLPSAPRWRGATYKRGSGANTLVFGYTVQTADLDTNGVTMLGAWIVGDVVQGPGGSRWEPRARAPAPNVQHMVVLLELANALVLSHLITTGSGLGEGRETTCGPKEVECVYDTVKREGTQK